MSMRGFTLIELLIVVAIIGILAAIAVPNFLNAQIKAKISRVMAEHRAIGEAYTAYKLDQSNWPPHTDRDPAQHRWITSPIAYLSTSVIDPFAQTPKGKDDFSFIYFQGQYHCEPAVFWYIKQWSAAVSKNPEFFQQTKNSAFYVMSLGPDSDFDESLPSAAIYDSSNGIVSNGDILRPVAGNPKKGYPYTYSEYQ